MNSSLTFNELSKPLAFIKVYWNGVLIFDDNMDIYSTSLSNLYEACGEDYVNKHYGKEGLDYVMDKYGELKVYSMNITVTEFHHCILSVIGEEPKI